MSIDKAHRQEVAGEVVRTCLTECCREWVAPFGFRGGRCGLCGERPKFIRMLPESEWVTMSPPIRPEDVQ